MALFPVVLTMKKKLFSPLFSSNLSLNYNKTESMCPKNSVDNNLAHIFVRVLSCVSCVPASCFLIWFVSCPCLM